MHSLLLPEAGSPGQVEQRALRVAARRLLAVTGTPGVVAAQKWFSAALRTDSSGALAILATPEVLEALLGEAVPEAVTLRRPEPRPGVRLDAPWPSLAAHVLRVGPGPGLGVAASGSPEDLTAAAVIARVRLVHAATPLAVAHARCRMGESMDVGAALGHCTALAVVAQIKGEESERAAAAFADLARGAEPTPAGEAHWRAIQEAVGVDRRRRLVCFDLDFDDFVYSEAVARSLVARAAAAGWAVDWVRPHPADVRRLEAELGEMPRVSFEGTEWWLRDVADVRPLAKLVDGADALFANVNAPEFAWLASVAPDVPWVMWARHLATQLWEQNHPPVHVARLHAWLMSLPFEFGMDRYTPHVHAQFWPMELDRLDHDRTAIPGRVFTGGDSARDTDTLFAALDGLPLELVMVTSRPEEPRPNVVFPGRLSLIDFCRAIGESEIVVLPLVGMTRSVGLTVLALAMLMGRAIVSTETHCIRHHVVHDKEALLVPEGDVTALRAALLDLHGDADKRHRLGRAAKARAYRDFDVRELANAMFATLENELAASS